MNKLTAINCDFTNLRDIPNSNINQFFSVPVILSDELLDGYFGRFGLLNGHTNFINSKRSVKRVFNNHYNKNFNFSLALQIAQIIGLESEKLVTGHTLVPIMRSINHKNTPIHDVKLLKAMGKSLAKPNLCFCESCIFDDLNTVGYSYWRRSHQIHGIDFCLKHEVPLMMAVNEDAAYQSPHKILKSGESLKSTITLSEHKHPVIQKYVQLITYYLENTPTVNYKVLIKGLFYRALTDGLIKGDRSKEYISDYIFLNTPHNWLFKHFPVFKNKTLYNPIQVIDSTKRTIPPNLFNLIIMISNLMPEADSNIFHKQVDTSSFSYARSMRPAKTAAILALYKKHCGNYKNILKDMSDLNEEVIYRLHQFGLPSLDNVNYPTLDAIQAFLKGAPLENILSRDSIDILTFEDALRASSQLRILVQ